MEQTSRQHCTLYLFSLDNQRGSNWLWFAQIKSVASSSIVRPAGLEWDNLALGIQAFQGPLRYSILIMQSCDQLEMGALRPWLLKQLVGSWWYQSGVAVYITLASYLFLASFQPPKECAIKTRYLPFTTNISSCFARAPEKCMRTVFRLTQVQPVQREPRQSSRLRSYIPLCYCSVANKKDDDCTTSLPANVGNMDGGATTPTPPIFTRLPVWRSRNDFRTWKRPNNVHQALLNKVRRLLALFLTTYFISRLVKKSYWLEVSIAHFRGLNQSRGYSGAFWFCDYLSIC